MKKIIILGGLLVVIGGIIWFANGSSDDSTGSATVKYTEPADAVGDFYKQWLKAAQDATVKPDRATLAMSEVLTKELRASVAAALQGGAALDPVLCQTVVPKEIVIRNVYGQADKAQVLVTSKDKSMPKQAVVDLMKTSDSWVMSGIKCTNGEVAPEREFTFEQEGFLIKNSVPKPFNNKNWHIVFTQDGKPGNVAPLLFDPKSQCTALDGTKGVCKPDSFMETSKVMVHGQMTERGVTVVRLEFVK